MEEATTTVEPEAEATEPTPEPEPTPEADEEQEAEEQAEQEQQAPEQPAGLTEKEWEARFKKAEKAFDSYARRVTEIWEDEATELQPVVLSPSAPPGFINVNDAGRVPDEIKEPILAFFGMPVEVDYEPDPARPTCDKCKGRGKIATGSQVPEWRTLACDACNGRGYIERAGTLAAVPQASPPAVDAGAPPAEVPELKDADDWGHPRLLEDGMPNPNYGKMPQYVDPRFP
jgi:hypothetical protein